MPAIRCRDSLASLAGLLLVVILLLAPAAGIAQFARVPKPAEPSPPPVPESGQKPSPEAEDSGFVIREDVRLVRVDVQVTEKENVVSGLSRSDFTILDEGKKVEITGFGEETDPVDLMLLLDVSGSMTAYLYEVSRAAGAAMEQLRPEDRVGVMIFSKQTKLLDALTSNHADIVTTLRSLTRLPGMGAGTAINASIMDAIEAFKTDAANGHFDPRHRRAILILTDNWGLNYKMPDHVVLRALHEQNISLHAIVVGRVQKPKGKWGELVEELDEEIDFSPANVFRLAHDTGGDLFTDLKKDKGLPEILSRIRTRYSLYFKPASGAGGGYRRIQVKLDGAAAGKYRKAEVRARVGYFSN